MLINLKENTSEADIKTAEDASHALPAEIKEIKTFESGTNKAPNTRTMTSHLASLPLPTAKKGVLFIWLMRRTRRLVTC